MIKKFTLVIMVFLVFLVNISAQEVTVFSINEVSGKSGDEVFVDLNISNNPSFGSLTLFVKFDTNKLEYIDTEVIGMENAMFKVADKNLEGYVSFLAITIDKDNLIDDNGTILRMNLKIKENVTSDIPLEINVKEFGIDENVSLDYKVKNGLIKIESDKNKVSVEEDDSLGSLIDIENKEQIKWESSDTNIATVDQEGNVKFKKSGSVTISATNSGEVIFQKNYEVVSDGNNIIIYVILGISFISVLIISFWAIRKRVKN